MGLPTRYRLRRRNDIARLRAHGQRFDCGPFVMRIAPANEDAVVPRFVIVTSRRVGNAVVRNRARRIMREIIRLNLAALPVPVDVMIIMRARYSQYSFQAIEADFLRGCRKLLPSDPVSG